VKRLIPSALNHVKTFSSREIHTASREDQHFIRDAVGSDLLIEEQIRQWVATTNALIVNTSAPSLAVYQQPVQTEDGVLEEIRYITIAVIYLNAAENLDGSSRPPVPANPTAS
jgi:hypothetical protein